MEQLNDRMKLLAEICKTRTADAFKDGSHDWEHTRRVLKRAFEIVDGMKHYKEEPAELNLDLLIAIVLLHDVADHKYNGGNYDEAADVAIEVLESLGFDLEFRCNVAIAISELPWSVGKIPSTIEGKIAQDADRLDAIGTIGAVRCFMYTGSKNGSIADAVKHFSDKLYKIPEKLNTVTAKAMAKPLIFEMKTLVSNLEHESNQLIAHGFI